MVSGGELDLEVVVPQTSAIVRLTVLGQGAVTSGAIDAGALTSSDDAEQVRELEVELRGQAQTSEIHLHGRDIGRWVEPLRV